jgi:hypothetical protein
MRSIEQERIAEEAKAEAIKRLERLEKIPDDGTHPEVFDICKMCVEMMSTDEKAEIATYVINMLR